jgi:cytidylate kinase
MAIITISRQFGAGGKTLGEMVAKALNYEFWDDTVIQELSKAAKVSPDAVKAMEKEAGNSLSKFVSGMVSRSFMERVLGDDKGYLNEEIYVELLHEVITKLAERDNIVLLGRASQYILQDHPNAYHILLIAKKEDRIKFMEKHYNMDAQKAKDVVEGETKRRANLYKKFGKTDYDDPSLYHITINTSKVSLETAVKQIEFIESGFSCEK